MYVQKLLLGKSYLRKRENKKHERSNNYKKHDFSRFILCRGKQNIN